MLNDPDSTLTLRDDGVFVSDQLDPIVLYYCGTCGGRIPNIWNARISDEERERLQEIVDSISTPAEAIQKLGPPDYDEFMRHCDIVDGKLVEIVELSRLTRNIEYYHLSDCANVEFYFGKDSWREGRIILKFTEDELRQFDPEPYSDGTNNGNEPADVIPYEINWVKCPKCGWRFRLDTASQSGEWPVHARCGQRLNVKASR